MDESNFSYSANLHSNKLQLNSTFGDDELAHTQITSNAALMDEIDLALTKCLEEQSCFKNLSIEKVRKGLYKVERKEYQFKII